jgi:hypothetical protein
MLFKIRKNSTADNADFADLTLIIFGKQDIKISLKSAKSAQSAVH